MTSLQWKQLHTAQKMLLSPERYTRSQLAYAEQTFAELSAEGFAEIGKDIQAIGAFLQAKMNELRPSLTQLYEMFVESGMLPIQSE